VTKHSCCRDRSCAERRLLDRGLPAVQPANKSRLRVGIPTASTITHFPSPLTRCREIARGVGYRDFVDAEAELAVWVDDRARTTGEEPRRTISCSSRPGD
jgi:hypothetical protein